jgi:dTMP kinase
VLLPLAAAPARAPLDEARTRYDRLEAEASEFHDRVRAAYLSLAEAEPERFLVVDASRPVDEIAGAIRARVAGLL